MPSDEDRAEIQKLLDARAEAVQTGDVDGLRSSVGGSGRFVGAELQRFEWITEVEFDTYSLSASWREYGDLARPEDARHYEGAEAVTIPATIERYRLAGHDDTDAVEEIFFTFVKREGRWRIESDSDVKDLGFLTARHLWDYGPVASIEADGFLVLARCGDARQCRELVGPTLELAARALNRATPYWKGDPHRRTVLLIPASGPELSRILQATFEVDDFVAFALSFIDGRDTTWFSGARVAFGPSALAGASTDRVLHILSHEFLHVMTRTSAGPFTPLWLEEGFAEYAGRDGDTSGISYTGFDGKLPENYEYTTGPTIFPSYQEGFSAVAYIVDRWGLDKLNRLYMDLGARRIAPGTERHHLDDVFRDVLGVSFRAFERQWASSIR